MPAGRAAPFLFFPEPSFDGGGIGREFTSDDLGVKLWFLALQAVEGVGQRVALFSLPRSNDIVMTSRWSMGWCRNHPPPLHQRILIALDQRLDHLGFPTTAPQWLCGDELDKGLVREAAIQPRR